MRRQQRKFPFRAFVLRDGVIGPGKHRPHGSRQAGLSLRARCAAAPQFAPLPPTYASVVSRLVWLGLGLGLGWQSSLTTPSPSPSPSPNPNPSRLVRHVGVAPPGEAPPAT